MAPIHVAIVACSALLLSHRSPSSAVFVEAAGASRTGRISPVGHVSTRGSDRGGGRGDPPTRHSKLDLSNLGVGNGRAGGSDLPDTASISATFLAGQAERTYNRAPNGGEGNDDETFWYGIGTDNGRPVDLQITVDPATGYVVGSASTSESVIMIMNDTATEIALRDVPQDIASDGAVKVAETARQLVKSAVRGGKLAPPDAAIDQERELQGTSYIDVLFPYTKRAMCAAQANDRFDDNTCEVNDANRVAIETLIQNSINGANQYLANSGITGKQFRLRHSFIPDETYDEYTASSFLDVLYNLPSMPGVQETRATVGADIVHLMIGCDVQAKPEALTCGRAYVGPVVYNNAYGVTCWYCEVSGKTVAHEIGHNLGLLHNKEKEGCPGPSICTTNTNFGYGECSDNTGSGFGYHTIMASGLACTNGWSNRVGHYSSADPTIVTSNGNPTGSPTENNAAHIVSNWAQVSAIMNEVMPTVSPSPTSSPTSYPTRKPTPAPSLVNVGGPCVDGTDCASGLCSGGQKASRVCLADPNGPAEPTPAPPPPTPPAPTPAGSCPVCPPTGAACCGNCVDGGKPANRGCF